MMLAVEMAASASSRMAWLSPGTTGGARVSHTIELAPGIQTSTINRATDQADRI